jgi:hypothetical protein
MRSSLFTGVMKRLRKSGATFSYRGQDLNLRPLESPKVLAGGSDHHREQRIPSC